MVVIDKNAYYQFVAYGEKRISKMFKKERHKKYKLAISCLLLLLFMQFAAIAHESEHSFNSTDIICIIHLDVNQFSNLLHSSQSVSYFQAQQIIPLRLLTNLVTPKTLTNYLSRAPPALFL